MIFFRTILGLIDVIQAGIALGKLLSDDAEQGFNSVLQAAHVSAWTDIIANGGLNAGQVSLANIAQDAGSEYLGEVSFREFSFEGYRAACCSGHENIEQALGQSVDHAGAAVNHARGSAMSGLSKWAAKEKVG